MEKEMRSIQEKDSGWSIESICSHTHPPSTNYFEVTKIIMSARSFVTSSCAVVVVGRIFQSLLFNVIEKGISNRD